MSVTGHGILVIDKPAGMTSRDAVDLVQRGFPRGTKIGHTGTLDPLASGVLVLCLGHATRLAEFVQAMPKTYICEFTLGARSETDDAEGPIVPATGAKPPNREAIDAALGAFVGRIEQAPPAYSAAKVSGERAYAMARRGRTVDLAARIVRIDAIEALRYDYPLLSLKIDCGKGAYIRALARDLGERLGCGGYVSKLRRTRVGPFNVEDAEPPSNNHRPRRLRPLAAAVAHLPAVTLTDIDITRLRQGQRISVATPCDALFVAVFDRFGNLAAVAKPIDGGTRLQPDRVVPA
jgi:tRNA pseudouridine55 synthase